MRNEALETHYINHFELLEVRHARDATLIPDEHGRPLLIGPPRPPARATDRAGRDLTTTLASVDGDVFARTVRTLARASGDDPFDHVDVVIPRPASDTAVVTLRLRNSLLNTVLLYDMMLAAPAPDHSSGSRATCGASVRCSSSAAGIDSTSACVSPSSTAAYREIERHPTYGPVAWREAATVVPVLERDSLRVRLTFAADEWRIDEVAIADLIARPRARTVGWDGARTPRQRVGEGPAGPAPRRRALRRDVPGQRFWVSFEAGPATRLARSFLLASQGYYSEWIRASWVRTGTDTARFRPGAAALDRTFSRWRDKRDSIDAAFFATRIPMETP